LIQTNIFQGFLSLPQAEKLLNLNKK